MTWIYEAFELYGLLILIPVVMFAQMGVPLGSLFFLTWYGSTLLNLPELAFAILVASLAGMVGDVAAYEIGRKNASRFSRYLSRHGKIKRRLDRSMLLMEKYGAGTILITRFIITGLGPIVNYALGTDRYHRHHFYFWVAIGQVIHAGEFLLLGYVLRETWENAIVFVSDLGWFVGLALFTAWLVYQIQKKQRMKRRSHV